MSVVASDHWGLELRLHGGMDSRVECLIVLFDCEALITGDIDGTTQPLNLLFHLGMLGTLANALEVGFDLALQLQPITPGAALEGVLDDIATQLEMIEKR